MPEKEKLHTWTAENDALLADLYREGKSTAYLAERFGATRDAIKIAGMARDIKRLQQRLGLRKADEDQGA